MGKSISFYNPSYAKAWLDEVKKRTGLTGLIYGSKESCFNAMDWRGCTDYPCWGAQYGSNNAVYGYESDPWQSSRPWGAWGSNVSVHQYTSNLILPGYGGRLDGNKAYCDLKALAGGEVSEIVPPAASENLDKASLLDLVARTWEGDFGTLEERKRKLGERYDEVQNFINHIATTDADQLAKEVWTGKYGNGELRKRVLHDRYGEVQEAVERLQNRLKPISEVAQDVIEGRYGNDPERTQKLRAEGYDSAAVQKEVNRQLGIF